MKELADQYVRPGGHPLRDAIRHVGEQLVEETDPEFQRQVSATFVLLGQEAATRRRYPAMLQLLASLQSIEQKQFGLARSLGARIGLENRLPDCIEEALRAPTVPAELVELLRRLPVAASEHIAGRLSRCTRRRERDRLIELASQLGPDAIVVLRDAFGSRPPAAAVNTVGLLSQLDLPALEELLPVRLREWNRFYHDAVVRQIASAGAPRRGPLLVKLLDVLDSLVLPLAIDEIGMTGDLATSPVLLGLARAELPHVSSPYVRVKAIEALGRLREVAAVPVLHRLVETKQGRRWLYEQELRIVAAQALLKIDAKGTESILSQSDLAATDLALPPLDRTPQTPGVRQRCYERIKLSQPLAAKVSTAEEDHPLAIHALSLGGGLASGEHQIPAGTTARIRIQSGLRSIAATVLLRDFRLGQAAFEIVDIELEERTKLRNLLAGLWRSTA
jgi:HEAT repeat protein